MAPCRVIAILISSLFVVIVYGSSSGAQEQGRRAQDLSGRVQDFVICKSPSKGAESPAGQLAVRSSAGKSVRTLRVYETKEKNENGESIDGCRATYSKTNVEQTVGTSRQLEQCKSILSGIRKNLEASNWSCRNAGAVAVLMSNEAEKNEALAPAVKSDAKSIVQ